MGFGVDALISRVSTNRRSVHGGRTPGGNVSNEKEDEQRELRSGISRDSRSVRFCGASPRRGGQETVELSVALR